MKELTIGKNDANQRLDRFLDKAVPLLPASLCQKYLRLKRNKVNCRKQPAYARHFRQFSSACAFIFIRGRFTPRG